MSRFGTAAASRYLFPPQYQSVEYGNASNLEYLVLNKPAGTVVGSLLIAQMWGSAASTWTAISPGWMGPYALSGSGVIFYKIADSSDVAASSFSFDASASVSNYRGVITRWSGHDLVTPIAALSGAYVSSGANPSSPTVIAVREKSTLYCTLNIVASYTVSATAPPGTTSIYQTNTTATRAGSSLVVDVGSTGAKQWTMLTSSFYMTSIVINPAI